MLSNIWQSPLTLIYQESLILSITFLRDLPCNKNERFVKKMTITKYGEGHYYAKAESGVLTGTTKESNIEPRSEEHTSELQSRFDLVCRLLLEKKNIKQSNRPCHA